MALFSHLLRFSMQPIKLSSRYDSKYCKLHGQGNNLSLETYENNAPQRVVMRVARPGLLVTEDIGRKSTTCMHNHLEAATQREFLTPPSWCRFEAQLARLIFGRSNYSS